jgi:hypothetical protein
MSRSTLLVAIGLALMTLGGAPAPAKSKETKKIFEKIAEAWKDEKVDKIAARLPVDEKVKLSLYKITPGKYSRQQATALLKKYFEAIKVLEFKKSGDPKGTMARFKHKFRVKSDRHEEERLTFITLDREKNRWVIVEILED